MMKLIGEILVQKGLVAQPRVEEALGQQKTLRKKLGEILLGWGDLDEDALLGSLAQQLDIPLADRRALQAPHLELVKAVPEPFAREHAVLPLRKDGAKVLVAMVDPENLSVLDALRGLLKAEPSPLLAAQGALQAAADKAYESLRNSGEVEGVLSGLEWQILDPEDGQAVDLSAGVEDAPIVKLVNLMLTQAIGSRATDIHIEPQTDKLVVRFRVDGALDEAMSAPLKSHPGVVSRLKVMSKLNIAETRLPQDGRFAVRLPDREVDVRVSVLPSVLGEKIVLRLLDKGFFDLSLEHLGFDERDLSVFRRAIRHPYGILLITGPTGAGKSTTLYSALREIQSGEDNIVTVEDPVEYQMAGITQVAVREDIGLSFAATLRSILRQDPDKVLIGEIRDRETADIAMKMALTGHLVLTTLHANDAASTVTRLMDIGVPRHLVGSSLVLVMAQRLLRKICPECKEEAPPLTPEERDWLGYRGDATLYHGKGCAKCRNTGYYGRSGIFELLPVSAALRRHIFAGDDQEALRSTALREGMRSLREAALEKMAAGQTTAHEVLKATVAEG